MSTLPSVYDYERFTDWVLDASLETDISSHELWKLRQQETEEEFLTWTQQVAEQTELSERDLIATAANMSSDSTMPDPPVPSLGFKLNAPSDEAAGQAATGSGPGSEGATLTDQQTERIVDEIYETIDERTETTTETAESPEPAEPEPATDEPPQTDSPTSARDRDVEQGPRLSDLTGSSEAETDSAASLGAGGDANSTEASGVDRREPTESMGDDELVTEAEYRQFQAKVQEIVQNLIDFLVSYDMLAPGPGGDDAEVKRRLQQAAEDADSPAAFFKQIETILSDLQGGEPVDIDGLAAAAESASAGREPDQSSDLAAELKDSIDELKQLQDNIRSSDDSDRSSTGDRLQTGQFSTDGSRTDDRLVVSRLNTLISTIQEQLEEFDEADDSGTVTRSQRNTRATTESVTDPGDRTKTRTGTGSKTEVPERTGRTESARTDVRAAVDEYLSRERDKKDPERATRAEPTPQDEHDDVDGGEPNESSVRAIVDEYLSDNDDNPEQEQSVRAESESPSPSREQDRPRADRSPVNTPAGATAATAAGAGATGADGQESTQLNQSFNFEGIEDVRAIREALLPIDFGWLFAALVYGGLDMFSTVLVLNNGGSELNPIYSILGESLVAFVIWKTLVVFALFVVFYPDDPRKPEAADWAIPAITGVAGLFLTLNNLLVLTTGSGIL